MSVKTKPDRSPAALPKPERPARVVIEKVDPEIDGGRFPIKRIVGEEVRVGASIHAEGHDVLAVALRSRAAGDADWTASRMEPLPNDRWRGRFRIERLTPYEYTIEAWVDHFSAWQRGFRKKVEAEQAEEADLQIGAALIDAAAGRASEGHAAELAAWAAELRDAARAPFTARAALALEERRSRLAGRYPDRRDAVAYRRVLRVSVDRERARFSTWYEMFPRSAAAKPGRHGTFADCEARLPYIAGMGFDVLYLPPIHPIGRSHRKGKNNAPQAAPDDTGSPWAIGAAEGGHTAIHPDLGTLDDFRRLLAKAHEHRIEIALDIAFQCSPDHPYVREHPSWFRHRPDGTIQYAENPPKKYEDIYPLDFESEDWESLWDELLRVVRFWVEQGVRIFRVDNPHTKPYAFWEWLIASVRQECPEAIFLAEAFTRPHVMYQLAKRGFSQSYTYFAWRSTSWEIRDYFTELTRTDVREFFGPSLWPNTPDILTEYLQAGGRPASLARLVLAATLGASYGVYGPAFELCDTRPLVPGREEYLDSEKYQIRHWEIDRRDSLRAVIARVNRIRRENPALQTNRGLQFHDVSNDQIVAYSKTTEDFSNIIITVVNLDPHHTHSGMIDLPLKSLGLESSESYQVHDLLSDARHIWHGARNYVELDPGAMPAHIFRARRRLRTERDFDYYL